MMFMPKLLSLRVEQRNNPGRDDRRILGLKIEPVIGNLGWSGTKTNPLPMRQVVRTDLLGRYMLSLSIRESGGITIADIDG